MEETEYYLTEIDIREAISKIAGEGNGYGSFANELIATLFNK